MMYICVRTFVHVRDKCACHLTDRPVTPALPWHWLKDEIQRSATILSHHSECLPLCWGYLTCRFFIVCCLHTISVLVPTCLSQAITLLFFLLYPSITFAHTRPCFACPLSSNNFRPVSLGTGTWIHMKLSTSAKCCHFSVGKLTIY